MRNCWHFYLFLIVLLVMCTNNRAQIASEESSEVLLKLDTQLVELDALIYKAKNGEPISDLMATDLELYEDNVKQQITNFRLQHLPLSMMIVIDISNSMKGVFEQAQNALLHLIRQSGGDDEIALMTTAVENKIIQELTIDRFKLEKSTKEIFTPMNKYRILSSGDNGIFLHEAVLQATEYMRAKADPARRKVIIVITDDYVERGMSDKTATEAEALSRIYESDIIVSSMVVRDKAYKGVHSFYKYTDPVLLYQRLGTVGRYASETGGITESYDSGQLDTIVSRLLANLHTRYSIAYTSSNQHGSGQTRKIKLQLTSEIAKHIGLVAIKVKKSYRASSNIGKLSSFNSKAGNEPEHAKPIQVVNVVSRFLSCWQVVKNKERNLQLASLRNCLQGNYPELINAQTFVIKPAISFDENLTKYLDRSLDYFRVHENMLLSLSTQIVVQLPEQWKRFNKNFPAAHAPDRIYLMPSLGRFIVRVGNIEGEQALLFGLDTMMSAGGEISYFNLLLDQILFRNYYQQLHRNTDQIRLPLYELIWQQALACYVSKQLNPVASKMFEAREDAQNNSEVASIDRLAQHLRQELDDDNDNAIGYYFPHSINEIYHHNDPGYRIGLAIVETLMRSNSIDALIKLQGDDLRHTIDYTLRKMEVAKTGSVARSSIEEK